MLLNNWFQVIIAVYQVKLFLYGCVESVESQYDHIFFCHYCYHCFCYLHIVQLVKIGKQSAEVCRQLIDRLHLKFSEYERWKGIKPAVHNSRIILNHCCWCCCCCYSYSLKTPYNVCQASVDKSYYEPWQILLLKNIECGSGIFIAFQKAPYLACWGWGGKDYEVIHRYISSIIKLIWIRDVNYE